MYSTHYSSKKMQCSAVGLKGNIDHCVLRMYCPVLANRRSPSRERVELSRVEFSMSRTLQSRTQTRQTVQTIGTNPGYPHTA